MLFKRIYCPKCGQMIDEMVDYCPYCKGENSRTCDFHQKFQMTFIPFYRQLMLFILGVLGFFIFNLLFSLIFAQITAQDVLLGTMLINLGSYILFFIFVIAIIFPYFKCFLKNLKTVRPYIYGMIGAVVVIIGSVLLNLLAYFIYPNAGTGGNQGTASSIATAYPIFAIVILGILGPICEEFAYRVGLFSFLRRVSPVLAYIGTALIFGLIHFDFTSKDLITELVYLPNYVFAGIMFSLLYEFGGIGASTTAHILNNLFSVLLIITGI